MGLSIYVEGDYEEIPQFWLEKNKANSVILPPRTPSARSFLMCKDSRRYNWLQTMKLQTLFPLRSPRALRSIGNAKQSLFRQGRLVNRRN